MHISELCVQGGMTTHEITNAALVIECSYCWLDLIFTVVQEVYPQLVAVQPHLRERFQKVSYGGHLRKETRLTSASVKVCQQCRETLFMKTVVRTFQP